MHEKLTIGDFLAKAGISPDPANEVHAREVAPTSLTACHFSTPGVVEADNIGAHPNLLITGSPGSGKTQLVLLLGLIHAHRDPSKTVFYIAPTRPLAQEAFVKFSELGKGILKGEVILSTGDESLDDWKIRQGRTSICCTVLEKFLSLLIGSWTLKNRISFVAVDETHMFDERERGVKLDMLLAALMNQKGAGKRIRVAALTVEGEDGESFLAERLSRISKNGHQKPLILKNGRKSASLSHYFAIVQNNRPIDKLPLLHLRDLRPEDDQPLTPQAQIALKEKIEKFICANSETRVEVKFHINAYAILQLWRKFPKLLVVSTSIPSLTSVATRLREELGPLQKRSQTFIRNITALRNEGIISKNLARQTLCLAEGGIFTHTGSMPKALRVEVEKVFQEDNDLRLLLFATTTLAYGVNLRVDAVALTTFRNISYHAERPFLNNIVFHNITGRAGRFPEKAGHAITLLPAWQTAEPGLPSALAETFAAQPLMALSPNPLDPQGDIRNNELANMLFFALSLADRAENAYGQPLPLKNIVDFLVNTIHARKAGANRKALAALARQALRRLAQTPCHGQYAVEMESDGQDEGQLFRITPRGEALLASGDDLTRAGELGVALRNVRQILPKSASFSPLFWLSALVFTPYIAKDINDIYKGSYPAAHNEADYKVKLLKMFASGLGMGDANTLYSAFERVLQFSVIQTQCLVKLKHNKDFSLQQKEDLKEQIMSAEPTSVEALKRFPKELCPTREELATWVVILKNIIFGIWKWMEGAPLDDVERESGICKSPKLKLQHFPPRLIERLSWQARLLAGFFGGSSLMGAAECNYVAMLSRRLQHGLPARLLPFYGKNLSRKYVVEMEPAKFHPAYISHELLQREKEYFQNESDVFCSWLLKLNARNILNSASTFLNSFWDSPREIISEAVDFLATAQGELPWRDIWRECKPENWYPLLWASLAAAALIDKGILAITDFQNGLPQFVDALFPLFDKKGVPAMLYMDLALIHSPQPEYFVWR